MDNYELTSLWKNAFNEKDDGFDQPRSVLKIAYRDFRNRVSCLLQQIHTELPSLTLHDITHVDSLWRVASEIAGPDFDLNPSEAFVLGGAFLLHDAAHCRAAFPGGLAELQNTTEWKDAAAQRCIAPEAIIEGSAEFQTVLFETLRVLHPKQASKLPFVQWRSESDGANLFLIQNDELRDAYGHIIGNIAESHWWHPRQLETFVHIKPTAPPYLAPANWTVDVLKLAVLLRTSDAAHIDKMRAPRFLMLMNQPQGISKEHWQFQARLNQPKYFPERDELIFSGSPYPETELTAWWLAFDTACLANKELASADLLLRVNRSYRLASRSVAGTHSPEAFSAYVPTDGWQPIDTNIKITDIKTLVARFGGEKLYGEDPSAALRELLQNAVDAVHACRSLEGLGPDEGEIEIAIEGASGGGGYWLHVTDTGIGMSRYVLTEVLLDFGRSFWSSVDLRGEWSGLASSGFEAIGQFGIGFFSVFMLGDQVRVITRRYESKDGGITQWLLDFSDGTNKRPTLREPVGNEKLKKHGTRVSVLISEEKLDSLCILNNIWLKKNKYNPTLFFQSCARLAPAIDLNLYVKINTKKRELVVKANDWLSLQPIDLLRRISPGFFENTSTDQFGLWTHLSELHDAHGGIIGRCAIQPKRFLAADLGVGVVNGLLAGAVNGVAGIIMSKPQSDLARKEAIPDISLPAVQLWAENQKQILLSHEKLGTQDSAFLAYFGANYHALKIGDLGGETVSFEEFIEILHDLSELIVHLDDFSYDPNDNVIERDFENYFDVIDNVIVVPKNWTRLGWRDQINNDNIDCETWSIDAAIDAALLSAWGPGYYWIEAIAAVGYVTGTEINRKCTIASRIVE